MKRKIIRIDSELCNGCGLCLPNCPEGAIQIIDHKARLVSDLACDGLGACLGHCPQGAITIEEREAEAYDEKMVMKSIVTQGENTIKAHLKHLAEHNQQEFLEQALDFLKENNMTIPDYQNHSHEHIHESSGCGCPGSAMRDMRNTVVDNTTTPAAKQSSQLRQWPVQMTLLNPNAAYFDDAELLISADCVPYAYADFHQRFLKGKIAITLCPKLDPTIDQYIAKLTQIFQLHTIKSVTVLHMEVPCCGGILALVEEALRRSGKHILMREYMIGINGELL
jgi:Fe-S-cluster-containing hydrogenase component 2